MHWPQANILDIENIVDGFESVVLGSGDGVLPKMSAGHKTRVATSPSLMLGARKSATIFAMQFTESSI